MIVFIFKLVQEIVNFKNFFLGYQYNCANNLIGLGGIYLFKFYIEEKSNYIG